jgi:hypothetical protein
MNSARRAGAWRDSEHRCASDGARVCLRVIFVQLPVMLLRACMSVTGNVRGMIFVTW